MVSIPSALSIRTLSRSGAVGWSYSGRPYRLKRRLASNTCRLISTVRSAFSHTVAPRYTLTRRVFNLSYFYFFTKIFQPSNILPGLVLAFLPMCRVQHSRPATSPSILSLRLLTHVESPSIFTLHTTFGAHAFRDGAPSLPQAREAAGNLIHDYWGAIRVKRDHASVPRTKEVHRRGQRPTDIQGTGTLLWSDREGIRQVRYI